MLGFNGGLIGTTRTTTAQQSVPGVWTLREQLEAKRAGLWPFMVREDANFSSVSLLLPCNGNNGSTIIFDYSGSPKNVSVFGDTEISTAQSKYYGSSAIFDGSGDYLTVASSADFGFGTGNFTVEYWVRPALSGDTNQVVIDARASNSTTPWLIGHTTGGAIRYYDGATVRTGGAMSANTWNHVAWSRSSNVNRIYLNGSQVSTYTSTQNFGSSNGLTIGSNVLTTVERFNGYISDIRITKGVARYTANFTPPDSFLL